MDAVLGIDTSNYKTSIALIGREGVISDRRRLLEVKEGERGLRQSEALFQHVKNLPLLMEEIKESHSFGSLSIKAVSVSSRPRPLEGSYMPCFLAGQSVGKSIAAMMEVPYFEFSHQEGHIEAIKSFSPFKDEEEIIACHFSGGTCEILKALKGPSHREPYRLGIIGGSKDISFGQVIDRTGVMMKMSFPCGEEMDEIASKCVKASNLLTPVRVEDGFFNLSGVETQIRRLAEESHRDSLIGEIFEKISRTIGKALVQSCQKADINRVIMSGGVSSSSYMRKRLMELLEGEAIELYFGDKDLSSDNGVGVALLGGKCLWD